MGGRAERGTGEEVHEGKGGQGERGFWKISDRTNCSSLMVTHIRELKQLQRLRESRFKIEIRVIVITSRLFLLFQFLKYVIQLLRMKLI